MSHITNLARAAMSLCLLATTLSASAQYYKLHNADYTFSGTGQFTTNLTNNGPALPHTTDSAGFLFSMREHPVAWAGVELNYGYTRFSEVYTSSAIKPFHAQTNMHEATAAYMFHPHFMHLQPFLNVGGGALDFVPSDRNVQNQWRGTGLVELGFDVPAGRNFGFRVQGRSLIYRAPDFGTAALKSNAWVATTEPSFGAYVRY